MQKLKIAGNLNCRILTQYGNNFEKVTEKPEKVPKRGSQWAADDTKKCEIFVLYCFAFYIKNNTCSEIVHANRAGSKYLRWDKEEKLKSAWICFN